MATSRDLATPAKFDWSAALEATAARMAARQAEAIEQEERRACGGEAAVIGAQCELTLPAAEVEEIIADGVVEEMHPDAAAAWRRSMAEEKVRGAVPGRNRIEQIASDAVNDVGGPAMLADELYGYAYEELDDALDDLDGVGEAAHVYRILRQYDVAHNAAVTGGVTNIHDRRGAARYAESQADHEASKIRDENIDALRHRAATAVRRRLFHLQRDAWRGGLSRRQVRPAVVTDGPRRVRARPRARQAARRTRSSRGSPGRLGDADPHLARNGRRKGDPSGIDPLPILGR